MQQLEIDFSRPGNPPSDYIVTQTTVAHRGEGLLAECGHLTGLSFIQVRGLLYNTKRKKNPSIAPKSPQCFALWVLCCRRESVLRSIFSRQLSDRRKTEKDAWRRRYNADYRSKVYRLAHQALRRNPKRRHLRRAWFNQYRQQKLRDDPNFRMAESIRARLVNGLKRVGIRKSHRTQDLLGCTFPQAKRWIESFWYPGMSWENYGQWHIDHVRPLTWFDLADDFQLRWACHYTNLQPLWAVDNLKKSDSVYEADPEKGNHEKAWNCDNPQGGPVYHKVVVAINPVSQSSRLCSIQG